MYKPKSILENMNLKITLNGRYKVIYPIQSKKNRPSVNEQE